MAPGLRQAFQKAFFAKTHPFKIYPGAVISVGYHYDILITDDMVADANATKTTKPLPPGVPLDEDIFDGILKHLWWYQGEQAYAVYQIVESSIDKLYMEALWRQIKRKKEQACSEI